MQSTTIALAAGELMRDLEYDLGMSRRRQHNHGRGAGKKREKLPLRVPPEILNSFVYTAIKRQFSSLLKG